MNTGLMNAGSEERAFGFGRAPEGLGKFPVGPHGMAVMKPVPSSQVPSVEASDWVEFFPNDPREFRANTNIGTTSGVPILNAIKQQIGTSTGYWLLADPNDTAAKTIGSLSNLARDLGATPGTLALLRSTFPSGNLKLEIALKTVPIPMKQTDGAAIESSDPCPSGDWQPISGATAATLPADKQTDQFNYYLQYIQQPQFLDGIPGQGKSWVETTEPVPVPKSAPVVYFSYAGQLYKIGWSGTWTPGQIIGSPGGSGPAIFFCTQSSVATLPGPTLPTAPPGVTVPGVSVPGPGKPSPPSPTTLFPNPFPAPGSTGPAPGPAPTPVVTSPAPASVAISPTSSGLVAPVASSSVPTWAWVVGGAAILGLIGFVAWSATQDSSKARENPLPPATAAKRRSRRRRTRRRSRR